MSQAPGYMAPGKGGGSGPCPEYETMIGGICEPSYQPCRGNNTTGTGFCDLSGHQARPRDVRDMSMAYKKLVL